MTENNKTNHHNKNTNESNKNQYADSSIITLNKVNCFYGKKHILKDVSFQLKQGTLTAFLGLNGAGKSTTMKIITGFLFANSGEVEILGKNPEFNYINLKKHIGYLPEENILNSTLTIQEHLNFAASVIGLNKLELIKHLDETIDILDLKNVLKRPTGELSKGYKQRCALAISLLHNPQILILDEPTSGLDPKQQESFNLLIKELSKEKTILISTHIISEVSEIADNYLVIYDGKISYDGKTDISSSELKSYLLGEIQQ